jgi:hypothetical protein
MRRARACLHAAMPRAHRSLQVGVGLVLVHLGGDDRPNLRVGPLRSSSHQRPPYNVDTRIGPVLGLGLAGRCVLQRVEPVAVRIVDVQVLRPRDRSVASAVGKGLDNVVEKLWLEGLRVVERRS